MLNTKNKAINLLEVIIIFILTSCQFNNVSTNDTFNYPVRVANSSGGNIANAQVKINISSGSTIGPVETDSVDGKCILKIPSTYQGELATLVVEAQGFTTYTFNIENLQSPSNVHIAKLSASSGLPTFTPMPVNSLSTATDTPIPLTNTPIPATATPTVTPSFTPIPATATPTTTPSFTPIPATATPTDTPSFTPILATATPTLTPSFTPTPLPTNTATQVNQVTPHSVSPTATVTPTVLPSLTAPILTSPVEGTSVAGLTTFTWRWSGTLTESQAFEVRIWKPDDKSHYGAHDAKESPRNSQDGVYSLSFDPSSAASVQKNKDGDYLWAVAVVEINPYNDKAIVESAPRGITITGVNAGSGTSTHNGGGTPNNGNSGGGGSIDPIP